MTEGRIVLSRGEVLRFNPLWDEGDRRQLEAFLEGNGEVLAYKDEVEHLRPQIDAAVAEIPIRLACMYRPASGGRVWGRDAHDKPLFVIRPGAIDLYMSIDRTVLHFSRVGHWSDKKRRQEEVVVTCPVHHQVLPASGICDWCE